MEQTLTTDELQTVRDMVSRSEIILTKDRVNEVVRIDFRFPDDYHALPRKERRRISLLVARLGEHIKFSGDNADSLRVTFSFDPLEPLSLAVQAAHQQTH